MVRVYALMNRPEHVDRPGRSESARPAPVAAVHHVDLARGRRHDDQQVALCGWLAVGIVWMRTRSGGSARLAATCSMRSESPARSMGIRDGGGSSRRPVSILGRSSDRPQLSPIRTDATLGRGRGELSREGASPDPPDSAASPRASYPCVIGLDGSVGGGFV
jgi:hypothetical protein